MRGTRLVLVPAVAAVLTSPLVAGQGKAPMAVSVTVVRTCTINSDGPTVMVKCGQRSESVWVTGPMSTVEGRPRSIADKRTVTIEF